MLLSNTPRIIFICREDLFSFDEVQLRYHTVSTVPQYGGYCGKYGVFSQHLKTDGLVPSGITRLPSAPASHVAG